MDDIRSPHEREALLQLILTEQFSHQQLTPLFALPRDAGFSAHKHLNTTHARANSLHLKRYYVYISKCCEPGPTSMSFVTLDLDHREIFQVFTVIIDCLTVSFLVFTPCGNACSDVSGERTASILRATESVSRGCWSGVEEMNVLVIRKSWRNYDESEF
jgi:hypothetical protein